MSSWCCDVNEKGVAVSTSLLAEVSKSGAEDFARKGGEDSGMEKEIGGCLWSLSLQRGSQFKKNRKVALNGNEVRKLTKA